MARSVAFWEKVKIDYEINGISYDKLSKKHSVAKSAIQARAKKESWEKEKTGQLIEDKVLFEKQKIKIQAKTGQFDIFS